MKRASAILVALLLAMAAAPVDGAVYDLPALRVTFTNGGERYGVDASGAHRTALNGPAGAVPSPDGTELAYVVARGNRRTELRVAAADGSSRKTVARVKSSYLKSPAWSPDGTQLAFVSGGSTRTAFQTTLEVVAPDGGGRRAILRTTTTAYDLITHVTWGPDGTGLFYAQGVSGSRRATGPRAGAPVRSDIRRVALDGTGDRVFLTGATEGVWSPDGTQFAYGDLAAGARGETCGADDCFANADLAVATADGALRHVLARTTANETQAAWSPDGTRLAFSSARNTPDPQSGDTEIYTIATDGSCLTWLTNGSPASTDPRWIGTGNPAPATCGAAGRTPRVAIAPLTPLWLGPRYGNTLLDGSREHLLRYEDCATFDPSACDPPFEIDVRDACRLRQRDVPFAGAGRRIGPRRYDLGSGHFLVGRYVVVVRFDFSDSVRRRRAVVRALRPVTGAQLGRPRLPPAIRALERLRVKRC